MKFKNAFSRPEEVMDFRKKWPRSWESHEISYFGPTISCCLKIGNILLGTKQEYAPKRLGFQHFLVMKNLKWSWKIL